MAKPKEFEKSMQKQTFILKKVLQGTFWQMTKNFDQNNFIGLRRSSEKKMMINKIWKNVSLYLYFVYLYQYKISTRNRSQTMSEIKISVLVKNTSNLGQNDTRV